MTSSEEHKTFNKASRWGHSPAATGRGAGRDRCGLHEHGDNKNRLHQTCGPVNQHRHVCVERCPLTTRHTANRSCDSCGESQRLSFGGTAAWRPKRNTELDHIHTLSLSESGPEQDVDEEPEQPSSGNTDLHAQSREGEESGACQTSMPRPACEGAC